MWVYLNAPLPPWWGWLIIAAFIAACAGLMYWVASR